MVLCLHLFPSSCGIQTSYDDASNGLTSHLWLPSYQQLLLPFWFPLPWPYTFFRHKLGLLKAAGNKKRATSNSLNTKSFHFLHKAISLEVGCLKLRQRLKDAIRDPWSFYPFAVPFFACWFQSHGQNTDSVPTASCLHSSRGGGSQDSVKFHLLVHTWIPDSGTCPCISLSRTVLHPTFFLPPSATREVMTMRLLVRSIAGLCKYGILSVRKKKANRYSENNK